jgi:LPS-assembly protein
MNRDNTLNLIIHSVSVQRLVKPYDNNITHVINPFASYTSAGSRYYDGYYETYKDSCDITGGTYAGAACEFYTLSAPSDTLSLGFNNYLFDNGSQFLVDRSLTKFPL